MRPDVEHEDTSVFAFCWLAGCGCLFWTTMGLLLWWVA